MDSSTRFRDKKYFGGNREKAIIRDGEKCVKCHITREEHRIKYSRDITVDHIDQMGVTVAEELRNNSMDNLQTLCISCHAEKDNKLSKLSAVDIRTIRKLKGILTQEELAKQFGVDKTHIYFIQANKSGNVRLKNELQSTLNTTEKEQ